MKPLYTSNKKPIKKSWAQKVVYHIYTRSFQDGKPHDGNGDLQGIIDKLDYLEDLGINAILISPINLSPMKDNGYDVEDYLNIHPMFGDHNTLSKLIKNLQERNIMLMMDFVPNHTSDKHKWFIESKSSVNNPKRNWYHWHPGKTDGSKPNNWVSVFDNTPSSAWTLDPITQEYYLHSFLKEQPDLNWDNQDVVNEMHNILMQWMDRGVNAFRIDVGLYIIKHTKYPDEPLNPDYIQGKSHPNDIYIHTASKDQPRGFKKLADMGNIVEARGGFVVQEVYIGTQERAMLYRLSEYGLSAPFDFDLVFNKTWDANSLKRLIFDYYAVLKDEDIVPLPLGNHDQPRTATRLGSLENARLAAMLQMTLDCIPFIFQGEEIGMEDNAIPPEKQNDPFIEKSRDPARTPMQWDDSPNAGFTEKNVEPWLPIAENYRERNVKKQRLDPYSMYSLYKKLIALRKEHLIPERPVEIDLGNDQILAYSRQAKNGKRILVLLNFGKQSEKINTNLLHIKSGTLLLNTFLNRENNKIIYFEDFFLNPKEGCIFLL